MAVEEVAVEHTSASAAVEVVVLVVEVVVVEDDAEEVVSAVDLKASMDVTVVTSSMH